MLDELTLPSSLLFIGDNCFTDGIANTIKFNDGLMSIGRNSFCDITDVEEIELPSTLMYVGEGSFSNLPNLKKVVLSPYMSEASG